MHFRFRTEGPMRTLTYARVRVTDGSSVRDMVLGFGLPRHGSFDTSDFLPVLLNLVGVRTSIRDVSFILFRVG
jgi:hypothetical protein